MSKKPNRADATSQMWVKVICGVMGFLMVFGVLVMLLSALTSNAAVSTTGVQDDQQISVGLYCNENAVQAYTLHAEEGFSLAVTPSGFRTTVDADTLSIAIDANLYRSGDQLTTESVGIGTVGGYHIQISGFSFSGLSIDTDHDNPVYIRPGTTQNASDGYTHANVNDYIQLLSDNSAFNALALPTFPYYVSTEKCYIRVGSFYTAAEAQSVLDQLQKSMTLNAQVVSPDVNTISILKSDYSIYCEIADKGQTFELKPLGDGVLKADNGRIYNGSIAINRVNSTESNGLSVINTLSLDTYVSALLSSEVSSEWSEEVLKTMAVVLRTEITRKIGDHKSQGFDICSESHCHAYVGGAPVTERVQAAVQATAGQILTYDDKPIYTPYATEIGSGTISSADAFGKELAYLPSIYTPWEDSSVWTVEFTPYELYQLLSAAGYTDIQGNIRSLEILSRADQSDYVESIRFTDIFDTTVTVEGSETIRLLFAGSLPSSCFVAGATGSQVSVTNRTVSDSDLTYTEENTTVLLDGTYGSFVFVGTGSGCGVGLSIKGALALAERGKNYEEILAVYYPNTKLAK